MNRNGTHIRNLQTLLDSIEGAAHADVVSFNEVIEEIGRRSFAPLILVAGVVTASPGIGDIPGVPILMGFFVLIVSGQLLLRREYFWLPQWLLRRTVTRKSLCRALGWLRTPARFIDRLLRPRLPALTGRAGSYATALACAFIALATPAMELVPMSANVAGLALIAFSLSLLAHDGLLALCAFVLTFGTAALLWVVLV